LYGFLHYLKYCCREGLGLQIAFERFFRCDDFDEMQGMVICVCAILCQY